MSKPACSLCGRDCTKADWCFGCKTFVCAKCDHPEPDKRPSGPHAHQAHTAHWGASGASNGALPVLGAWGLARRIVHVWNQAQMDASLGIVRTFRPSEKWFETAERYRKADVRRYYANFAASHREHYE
jgi:hypothetical protein